MAFGCKIRMKPSCWSQMLAAQEANAHANRLAHKRKFPSQRSILLCRVLRKLGVGRGECRQRLQHWHTDVAKRVAAAQATREDATPMPY
eukprot:442628-Rhodomonas_salina.3